MWSVNHVFFYQTLLPILVTKPSVVTVLRCGAQVGNTSSSLHQLCHYLMLSILPLLVNIAKRSKLNKTEDPMSKGWEIWHRRKNSNENSEKEWRLITLVASWGKSSAKSEKENYSKKGKETYTSQLSGGGQVFRTQCRTLCHSKREQ